MSNYQELFREWSNFIKYKDYYFFISDSIEDLYMQVQCKKDQCARTGETITWSGRKWRLSKHMIKSEFIQTCLMAVIAAEEHEVRENFLYKGKAIFGPHFDVDALHEIVDKKEKRKPT